MRCPSCGFDNASGIKFCGECGALLKLKCPGCGFDNAPGIKFCGECGGRRIAPSPNASYLIFPEEPEEVCFVLAILLPQPRGGRVEALHFRLTASGVGVVLLGKRLQPGGDDGNEVYLQEALKAGAAGYLLKDAERSELELAIRTVIRGGTYLTPAVAKFAVDAFRQQTEQEPGPLRQLTPRQREILQLIAEGHTTKDMARRLNLSIRTVETHRADLMERLKVHDIAGLVRLAVRAGLVNPDS